VPFGTSAPGFPATVTMPGLLGCSYCCRVETVRAVRVSDPAAVPRAREVAASVTLIRLDDSLYDLADDLEPASLRSFDAVHLAAALSVGNDLAGVVTYDARMEAAAVDLHLHVEAPGRSPRSRRRDS
jgi:uncharacterized protein